MVLKMHFKDLFYLFTLLTYLLTYRALFRMNFIPVDQYQHPKKCSQKTKNCLFLKRKFNETNKDFSINYTCNSKCGKTIFQF